MKIIKVVYNNDSNFILDILNKVSGNNIIESYNLDYNKDKKGAYPLMTRFGTKNVPLVVFTNENLDEYDALWSENNPDWEKEIKKKLNDDNAL